MNTNYTLEQPKISICCTSYNHSKYAAQAIESIVSQNYKNLEILIIDDGSIDGTIQVLKKAKLKYNQIKHLILQPNTGKVGKNLNKLIRLARGEYIMFLSLDDIFFVGAIEKILKEIASNPSVQFVVSSKHTVINSVNKITQELILFSNTIEIEHLLRMEKSGGSFWLSSAIYRKKILEYVGGFDENLIADDIILRIKLLKSLSQNKNFNFKIIQFPIFKYRIHENNVSKNIYRQFSILYEVNKHYFNNSYNPTLNDWLLSSIIYLIKKGNLLDALLLLIIDNRNQNKVKVITNLLKKIFIYIQNIRYKNLFILFLKNFVFFNISLISKMNLNFSLYFISFLIKIYPGSLFLNQINILLIFNSENLPFFLMKKNIESFFNIKYFKSKKYTFKKNIEKALFLYSFPHILFYSKTISKSLAKFLIQHFNKLSHEHSPKLRAKSVLNSEILILRLVEINEIEHDVIKIPFNKEYKFSKPKIFGQKTFDETIYKLSIPNQSVSILYDVQIIERFQICKDDKFILVDKSGDLRKFNPAGLHFNYFYYGIENLILYKKCSTKRRSITIEEGIYIGGRVTENYFHWLIEYLPKLFNIEILNYSTSIPILIKRNLPIQFYEALNLICPKRHIQYIDPDEENIYVKKIYIPSFHTFHPDDFESPYWKGSVLSHQHLHFVRSKVLNCIKNDDSIRPKRIYLSRSNTRGIINYHEIERILIEFNIQIIAPEKLSFRDQVLLFYNAELIVSPAGAALSNLIFARPGTNVICFIAERNRDYCMQSNLALFSNLNFVHLLGQSEKSRLEFSSEEEFVHSSFYINPIDLENLLMEIKTN